MLQEAVLTATVPPSQAQGNAVSASPIGYQLGPRFIGIAPEGRE